ncbi:MAG: hypothetical protein DRG20_05730 [Deltaproteobacteria bacterium]|nr:MAG: hypothetical protein DRG20_05730 [Deltaproteobacteria bacterium]
MVVECPKCKTKFMLDEKKLKHFYTKARCSICGHIFVIQRIPSTFLAKERSKAIKFNKVNRVQKSKCIHCGYLNLPHLKFCERCGKELKNSKENSFSKMIIKLKGKINIL